MNRRLDVRQAEPDDLDALLAVLDEAAAWLQEIGVQQWPASYSQDPELVALIRSLIGAREIFVATNDERIVGCFWLSPKHPTGWLPYVDAFYLYSLAVARNHAGEGVGRFMLDWAAGYARSQGKEELRLDCWAGSQKLRAFYSAAGFEWRRDLEITSGEESSAVPEQHRGTTYSVSLFARSLITGS